MNIVEYIFCTLSTLIKTSVPRDNAFSIGSVESQPTRVQDLSTVNVTSQSLAGRVNRITISLRNVYNNASIICI